MQLRYSFRLYRQPGQVQALARAFGCARVVFNDGLRLREQARMRWRKPRKERAAGTPAFERGRTSRKT